VPELLADHVEDRVEGVDQLLAEAGTVAGVGRLHLDDDGVGRQAAPLAGDGEAVVDVGHGGVMEGVAAHGPRGLVAPGNRPQEHDLGGSQLLETVEDERRRARQLLDDHAGGPVELLEAVDDLAAEVEVAHAGPAEAAHEGAAPRARAAL
jgi:hypothetical protein